MAPMAGGSMVPAGEGGRSPVETLFAAAGDDQEALLAMIEERYGDMAAATTPGERAGLAKQLRSMWVLAFERDLSRVANLIFPKMSKELALDEALNQKALSAATFLLEQGVRGLRVEATALSCLAQCVVDASGASAGWEALLWRMVELARGEDGAQGTHRGVWTLASDASLNDTSRTAMPPIHGRWEGALCILVDHRHHLLIERCLDRWTHGAPRWTLTDHLSQAETLMAKLINQDQVRLVERLLSHGVNADAHYRVTSLKLAMARTSPATLDVILEHTPDSTLQAWTQKERLINAAVRAPSLRARQAVVARLGDLTPTLESWTSSNRWDDIECVLIQMASVDQAAWVERFPTAFPQVMAQLREQQTLAEARPGHTRARHRS